MTRILRRLKFLWVSSWPLWMFLLFESLAIARLLPEGYMRAGMATPIVLIVPGSLTLGALFSKRRRPKGTEFVCYAVLLSAIWSGFASLILYVCGVLITADSTILCLLVASVLLTIVAEVRFLLDRQGQGRRAIQNPESADPDDPADPDMPVVEVTGAKTPTAVRGTSYYTAVATIAGVSLLAGGLYTYDRLPRPTPTGFTSMAWTGPLIKGDISIGSTGKELGFQVVHHEPDTTSFRLSAAWSGNPRRPLAKTLNLTIAPNRTFQGALLVPPLPDGCIYRIVVTLTATRQIDPLTNNLQTWSINVDVHDPIKSQKTCK